WVPRVALSAGRAGGRDGAVARRLRLRVPDVPGGGPGVRLDLADEGRADRRVFAQGGPGISRTECAGRAVAELLELAGGRGGIASAGGPALGSRRFRHARRARPHRMARLLPRGGWSVRIRGRTTRRALRGGGPRSP